MLEENDSYVIEEVKEEIMVPGGEVYVLTAKYVPTEFEKGDQLWEGKYDIFVIYRDKDLLQEILNLSKQKPYWQPFKFKSKVYFKNTTHVYVNGKVMVCYKGPFLSFYSRNLFKHFENEYDKKKIFLKKVYNSISLNEDSMETFGYQPPYYLYVYVPRFNHFVIKRNDEVLSDECVFDGLINLNEYRQLIKSKYGEAYVNYLNKALGMRASHNEVEFGRLEKYGEDYFNELHHYHYEDIENIKFDIATVQLRKFHLEPNSDPNQVYF